MVTPRKRRSRIPATFAKLILAAMVCGALAAGVLLPLVGVDGEPNRKANGEGVEPRTHKEVRGPKRGRSNDNIIDCLKQVRLMHGVRRWRNSGMPKSLLLAQKATSIAAYSASSLARLALAVRRKACGFRFDQIGSRN